MSIIKSRYILAAAAATAVAVAAAFDRPGLVVPYAEDRFPDMASMRYDRSPYYRALERVTDSATITFPIEWTGKRIVVGVGYPSDTFPLPHLTINGITARPGIRPLRWEADDYSADATPRSVTLRGLGKRPVRVYAYATPRRVWVDDYHILSALDSTDLTTGIFEVDIRLGGVQRTDPSVAVEYMLFDSRRHQVAAGRADASPHLRFRARIPDIHPWSTDDPHRYMLAIILRDDRTGEHITTVGTPMRFANYTERSSEGPVLNNVHMAPLALARLDTVPVNADDRLNLARDLRATGVNAVISPAGYDPDTDWRNICADRGILCYADGALDLLVFFAADPEDAELVQHPGGMDRAAKRYARVSTALTDTATLTITATTRSPFAPLGDFALDYELVTPLGKRLTSSQGVVTQGDPRTPVDITLNPQPSALNSQLSALDPNSSEAYLNLTWHALRPMAGVETPVVAETQYVIGHPAPLPVMKPEKLKRKKNGLWRGGDTELILSPGTGLPASLRTGGREMLQSPLQLTIDGMAARATATHISYDRRARTIHADIDIDNSASGLPIGHARLGYSINPDGTLDISIDPDVTTPGTAITFGAAADRIYLGRGPGDSPATSPRPGRIALYQARAGKEGPAEAHADTRHITLLSPAGPTRNSQPATLNPQPSTLTPQPSPLTSCLDRPAEVTLGTRTAAISTAALRLRLSPAP